MCALSLVYDCDRTFCLLSSCFLLALISFSAFAYRLIGFFLPLLQLAILIERKTLPSPAVASLIHSSHRLLQSEVKQKKNLSRRRFTADFKHTHQPATNHGKEHLRETVILFPTQRKKKTLFFTAQLRYSESRKSSLSPSPLDTIDTTVSGWACRLSLRGRFKPLKCCLAIRAILFLTPPGDDELRQDSTYPSVVYISPFGLVHCLLIL